MSDNEEVWRQALAAVTAENHALRAQNAYLAPRQRAGQLVANAMHAVDPVFYEAHHGDFTDPFNNDGRIEAYLRTWRESVADGLRTAVVEYLAAHDAARREADSVEDGAVRRYVDAVAVRIAARDALRKAVTT